ncbi:TRCF domain-containing protein [Chelatococcus sp. GCM10030263]|uniref:TRCF domain-containing protein n=1 Tax=Chelatococcus sp. GCM10030263 TaxID=3273387 RepID=UPI0036184185
MPADVALAPPEITRSSPLGAIGVFLLGQWRSSPAGLLFLSGSERRAEHLGAILYALDPACDPMVLPRSDALPYDDGLPSRDVMGRRASVLRRVAQGAGKPLVLAVADAALLRVPPRDVWADATLALRLGMPLDLGALQAFLDRTGYVQEARADEPGEVAVHGQVVDVYPAGALGPVRIELGEGRIEGLQSYDPLTQRTTGELAEVVLDPASEMFALAAKDPACPPAADVRLQSLFDYMPEATIVKGGGVETRGAQWLRQIAEARETSRDLPLLRASLGAISPDRLYLSEQEWQAATSGPQVTELAGEDCPAETRVPRFATRPAPLRALRNFLGEELARGRRVVLTAADDAELRSLERRAREAAPGGVQRASSWPEVVEREVGTLSSLRVDCEAGFVLPSLSVSVVTAADVFGSRAAHEAPLGLREQDMAPAREVLRTGDIVVHLERGVGQLRGIETISGTGLAERDMVRLEYAGGAVVMVPVEELALVWKYGAEAGIQLDRPDGGSWEKRRGDLEKEIEKTAARLAALASERAAKTAPKLVPSATDYERFVARFPFFATPDQARAAEEVLQDLASGRPMNRLVCGDVGFGKTEVALRAAAAAALSGFQVAVAVPTTVLARQHLETFRRRFAGFDVTIGHLSRFASATEARSVKDGLADGSIRIVIGTHAIAGKDVAFKELGLVIIDEEQRFGAKDKEKLRALGEDLHVLTLTATPIPRTLQHAVTGLADLSVIATPPARRMPVRTIAAPFADEAVRSALTYEHRRGGQSFVVCPRIQDIEPIAARLREIVPALDLRVVHGRMPAQAIDDVMVAFAAGQGDVLVATNIIESGLDLPRANTILVCRPDRFGLAQLHQLRGRVGRGARRGFAYLLSDPEAQQTEISEERLQALQDLERLGAGFAISERDLNLRGAGDLLGEDQTGHLKLVGPSLYRHLIDRALRAARGEDVVEDYVPELNLDATARIPPDYVPDEEARLELYGRVARAATEGEVDELEDEIEDRFGSLPEPVRDLLALARIRQACRRLGIARIDAGPQAIAITFRGKGRKARATLKKNGFPCHWNEERLIVAVASETAARLGIVGDVVSRLG